jgi:hypothetical protein
MTDRQPDFVIVGATKSATTWLQRNLQQHSAVFMPGAETHYFSRHFERGPLWYGAFFAPAAAHQIVGERSTSYLDDPQAAQRLRAVLPDVRVIMQLRNPIERVWAHYWMNVRRGETRADVDRQLCADDADGERLRAGGLYFRHVARFFELFPREQLCVSLYDDLDREPVSVLDRIRAHVGLASVAAPAPAPVGEGTPRARPARYPALSQAIRAGLRSYYEDDVRALSDLLGRDLSAWLGAARRQA